MSQTLESPPQESEVSAHSSSRVYESTVDSGLGEFEYRPMPVLAPITGVLGVCSLTALLGLFGIGLGMLGVLVGLLACWQIFRSQGAYSGMRVALTGLVASLVFSLSGVALQVYNYRSEVPEGYTRVSFSKEISAKGFVMQDGYQDVHPDVKALADQPIFLKGFMYPTNQEVNLSSFLMLKDSGQCCFGGQPALQDMIGVEMRPGQEVDYYNGRVAVAGRLKFNPNYRGGSLEPLYLFEADQFSRARTSF